MSQSPSRISGLLQHPYFWLWLGAGMFAVSLAACWKPDVGPDRVAPTASLAKQSSLPVLSADRVPQQPRLYPYRLPQVAGGEPAGSDQVTRVNHIVHPLETTGNGTASNSVVHADWETPNVKASNRIRQVSVSYVEPEATAPVWLTGNIEIADASLGSLKPSPSTPQPTVTDAEHVQGHKPLITTTDVSAEAASKLPLIIPAVRGPQQ